ncbi:MAG TPA: roadblock/LC7 domain-containing protein [Candidatus Lokiarchaeia archaeon]|nr:roadblock/LC7 domain-containing protein [Candidatus Lokiarchaeia archaeon]
MSTDNIRQVLEQIGQSVPGILHVILMDKTGLMVADYSKYVFKQLDIDAVGAIMGAVFQAAEEESNSLEFGGLEIQINEFKNGFRFAVACEDIGVLAVVTDKDVQIGLVRGAMKKYAATLAKAMKKTFSTANARAMEDLRDLFSSDGL